MCFISNRFCNFRKVISCKHTQLGVCCDLLFSALFVPTKGFFPALHFHSNVEGSNKLLLLPALCGSPFAGSCKLSAISAVFWQSEAVLGANLLCTGAQKKEIRNSNNKGRSHL